MQKLSVISVPQTIPEARPRTLREAVSDVIANSQPLAPSTSLGMHRGAPVLVLNSLVTGINIEIAMKSGTPKLGGALDVLRFVRETSAAPDLFKVTRNFEARLAAAMDALSGGNPESMPHQARAVTRAFRFLNGHIEKLPASSVSLVITSGRKGSYVFEAQPPPAVENARAVLNTKVDALRAEAASKGLREKEQAKIDTAYRALARYESTLQLWGEGADIHTVRSTSKISDKTLHRWLNGKLPEEVEFLEKRHPGGRVDPLKGLSLPRSQSLSWAYLLGAYQAVTSHRGMATGLRFSHPDKEPIDRIAATIESLDLGVNVKTGTLLSHGQLRYFLRVASTGLARKLHDFSAANSRVVWEALGTPEEEREFLRGHCSFRGAFGNNCFQLSYAQHRGLAMQLAGLFAQVGVRANTAFGEVAQIRIASHQGLQSLVTADILPAKMQQAVKANLAARTAPERYDRSDLDRIAAHFKQFPNSTLAYASQVTKIPASVIGEWRNHGVRPSSLFLEQVADVSGFHLPNHFVPAYLYRQYGEFGGDAAAMATKWSLEEIKAAEARVAKLGRAAHISPFTMLKGQLDRTPRTKQ